MGLFDGVKSTLKKNSFVGVMDGWKDGVENKLMDSSKRGYAGNQSSGGGVAEQSGGGGWGDASGNAGVVDNGVVNNGSGSGGSYTGAYTGGGGGVSRAPAYNADDLAYLNDQENKLRSMFGEADTALSQGLTTINDNFGRQEQRKNEAQAKAMRDYQTKEDDTTRAKGNALTRTASNARTLAEGIRRRLGMASGSSSSAYQMAAPNAVARDATKNRTGVMENYATNFRDLNTARDDAKSQFQQMMEDLASQKKEKESALQTGISNSKIDVNNKLASLAAERTKLLGGGYGATRVAQQPFEQSIAAEKTRMNSLYDQFRTPFTPKAVQVKQPTLRDYLVENAGISPEQQQEQTYTDYLNQYKKDDEEGMIF